MTWPDGRKHDGSWKANVPDGVGLFTDEHGKVRKGEWENGEFKKWFDEDKPLHRSRFVDLEEL